MLALSWASVALSQHNTVLEFAQKFLLNLSTSKPPEMFTKIIPTLQ